MESERDFHVMTQLLGHRTHEILSDFGKPERDAMRLRMERTVAEQVKTLNRIDYILQEVGMGKISTTLVTYCALMFCT